MKLKSTGLQLGLSDRTEITQGFQERSQAIDDPTGFKDSHKGRSDQRRKQSSISQRTQKTHRFFVKVGLVLALL